MSSGIPICYNTGHWYIGVCSANDVLTGGINIHYPFHCSVIAIFESAQVGVQMTNALGFVSYPPTCDLRDAMLRDVHCTNVRALHSTLCIALL